MASPQTENGYTRIATELLEALSRLQISGSEWSVILCIIRKTYGFQKKEDWVTNTQIAQMTGLHKVRVSEAKMRLLEANIVTEKRNKIGLQKDYEQWKKLRKSVTIVTEKRNKVLRKSVPTIDKKDTIQKITSKQGLLDKSNMQNLIPEVIKLFESVDGKNKNYYGNKTQREACQFLLDEYGFDEIIKRIEVLPKSNTMQYFPTITTPCQLRDKWVQLDNAVARMKNKIEEKNNQVIF